LRSSSYL